MVVSHSVGVDTLEGQSVPLNTEPFLGPPLLILESSPGPPFTCPEQSESQSQPSYPPNEINAQLIKTSTWVCEP